MTHDSGCAVHNAPALPVGKCDCSACRSLDALVKALELIAAFKGKTIFSTEPEYRAGAHAAYEQAADIAIDALALLSDDRAGG